MNSSLAWTIIKHFLGQNTLSFGLQDVVREFPGKNPHTLSLVLSSMVREGMLCRITRNLYHIIPPLENPDTFTPDGPQGLRYFMRNRQYYFAYASALRIHGLTGRSAPGNGLSGIKVSGSGKEGAGDKCSGSQEVIPLMEYVVTEKQINKNIRKFGSATYKFIKHGPTRFFGFERKMIRQLEEAMVSDLEKTIVDIATKPGYGGGLVELGSALIQIPKLVKHDKLFYYFSQNENMSAMKRFLYLSDLLGLVWKGDREMMLNELGPGISLLDPNASKHGKIHPEYRLKINLDPDHLREMILHQVYPERQIT